MCEFITNLLGTSDVESPFSPGIAFTRDPICTIDGKTDLDSSNANLAIRGMYHNKVFNDRKETIEARMI